MAASALKPLLFDNPTIEKFANQFEFVPESAFLIGPDIRAELVKLPDGRLIHRLLEFCAEGDNFFFHPEQLVVVIVAVDFDVGGLRMQAEKEHGKPAAQTPQ